MSFNKYSLFKKIISTSAFFISLVLALSVYAQPKFDAGPDINTPMGKELVQILSEFPDYAGISIELTNGQKFRPAFGPVPWRMLLQPNSVKILFQGQDATHIAEAANRPATAGFGGRAMDLAKYMGVGPGAGFINAYASTIQGQYGAASSPIVVMNEDGSPKTVLYKSFVSNELWAMSMDPVSPIANFRNKLISWIIRNNPDSLQMIVLFGGASRDAFASFVEAKGGQVGTSIAPEVLKTYRVPEMRSTNAGGNNEVAFPLTLQNKDLYAQVLGKKVNYKLPQEQPANFVSDADVARKNLQKNIAQYFDQMKFLQGGVEGSGVLHPAQIGGYDIDKQMYINGKRTISLKGLNIDGFVVKNNILVRSFPHPTRLSMMTDEQAAQAVAEPLKAVIPYVKSKKWSIPSDVGFTSDFFAGLPYRYARAEIGPETYNFGTPASRMVNVSSGVRAGKNVVIFGTRDKVAFVNPKSAEFDLSTKLNEMQKQTPTSYPKANEMWNMNPNEDETAFLFDPGPNEKYYSLMKDNIPESLIKKYFKVNRDYSHYRGTFDQPKVFILADPHGYDDLRTDRALTGARGQYLHGLMENAGIGDQYLLLKTAPFAKESFNPEAWAAALEATKAYRERIIQALLEENDFKFILADGEDAIAEIHRIMGDQYNVPIIDIARTSEAANSGIDQAAKAIKKIEGFSKKVFKRKMVDIPRSHMTYTARWWEGTSGDRVITATNPKYRGKAFAVVVPDWVTNQEYRMPQAEAEAVQLLKEKIEVNAQNITSCELYLRGK